MNEFVAKKLGEVLAFAVVGIETFEKGKASFESVFGEEFVENTLANGEKHRDIIKQLAKTAGQESVVNKKLDGTGSKLRAMRDLYVADQWDNPTELMEWSGFFEGAAIVHWELVKGAGEATSNAELVKLSEEAGNMHKELLYKSSVMLNEIGKKKSV